VTEFLNASYATARKIVVAVIGGTVVAIGVVMIVLPGPALVVIPAGLAILAIEFAWARRWLKRLKDGGEEIWGRISNGGKSEASPSS
jgi:tellurite resistance protein TerC